MTWCQLDVTCSTEDVRVPSELINLTGTLTSMAGLINILTLLFSRLLFSWDFLLYSYIYDVRWFWLYGRGLTEVFSLTIINFNWWHFDLAILFFSANTAKTE